MKIEHMPETEPEFGDLRVPPGLTAMLTYKCAHTPRETHAARERHINILWFPSRRDYYILGLRPLTNCSEFHLYYDI